MTLALTTSSDGTWAAARDGQTIVLFEKCAGAPVGRIELASDDVDFALVGPPTTLAVVTRSADGNAIELYVPPPIARDVPVAPQTPRARSRFQPAAPADQAVADPAVADPAVAAPVAPPLESTAPQLTPATRLELDIPARLAAVTGPRLALVSPDAMHVLIVRSAGHALSSRLPTIEGPIEFVVGLDRDQLLFGLLRKVEIFDAVSCRAMLRPQWPLPPQPRVLGSAFGHLWAMRQNSDVIVVYRLSDGRPFEHEAGAQIQEVVSHPASPVIVLVTASGLLRLHCHAHSVTPIRGVPDRLGALALAVDGEEISVVGFTGIGNEPWRVGVTRPS